MTPPWSLCENVFGTITRPGRPVGNVLEASAPPRSLCENVFGTITPPRSLCENVFETITRPRSLLGNVFGTITPPRSLLGNVLDASPRLRNRFGTFPPALRGVETSSGAFALVFARRVGLANTPLVERDGVVVGPGALGTFVSVDPGGHEVVASAPGYEKWSSRFIVDEGPSKKMVVVSVLESVLRVFTGTGDRGGDARRVRGRNEVFPCGSPGLHGCGDEGRREHCGKAQLRCLWGGEMQNGASHWER